jgi:RsiW-degrading membrane proteinase PrsW (M82 family)
VSPGCERYCPSHFFRTFYSRYNEKEAVLSIPVRVKTNRVTAIRPEQQPWRLATHPAITSDLLLTFFSYSKEFKAMFDRKDIVFIIFAIVIVLIIVFYPSHASTPQPKIDLSVPTVVTSLP